jgi:hypothetical protein
MVIFLQRYRITDLYTNAPQGWYYYIKVSPRRTHREANEAKLTDGGWLDRGSTSGLSSLISLVSLPTCQDSSMVSSIPSAPHEVVP